MRTTLHTQTRHKQYAFLLFSLYFFLSLFALDFLPLLYSYFFLFIHLQIGRSIQLFLRECTIILMRFRHECVRRTAKRGFIIISFLYFDRAVNPRYTFFHLFFRLADLR